MDKTISVIILQEKTEFVEQDMIKDMESRMYELTKQDDLSLTHQLATKNNIAHPLSLEKEETGADWLK